MLSIVFGILAAICICDYIAFFVYAIKYRPVGLTEGICYPFFIPMKMHIALIVRVISLVLIIVGAYFFSSLNPTWKLWLPIGTLVVSIIYSILFCVISYN